MIHDLSESTKRAIDAAAVAGALVAGISLAQAALVISILAGLVSIILGAIRIYDRLKFGRATNDRH
jgi:hypothetical protein